MSTTTSERRQSAQAQRHWSKSNVSSEGNSQIDVYAAEQRRLGTGAGSGLPLLECLSCISRLEGTDRQASIIKIRERFVFLNRVYILLDHLQSRSLLPYFSKLELKRKELRRMNLTTAQRKTVLYAQLFDLFSSSEVILGNKTIPDKCPVVGGWVP